MEKRGSFELDDFELEDAGSEMARGGSLKLGEGKLDVASWESMDSDLAMGKA